MLTHRGNISQDGPSRNNFSNYDSRQDTNMQTNRELVDCHSAVDIRKEKLQISNLISRKVSNEVLLGLKAQNSTSSMATSHISRKPDEVEIKGIRDLIKEEIGRLHLLYAKIERAYAKED